MSAPGIFLLAVNRIKQGEGISLRKAKLIRMKTGFVSACLIGCALALVLTIVGSMLGAVFINNEYLDINVNGVLGIVIRFLSVFLGAVLAGKLTDESKMLCCMVVAGAYFAILCGSSLLFFEGIGVQLFAGFLTCLAACVGGILLSTKAKTRVKHKRRGRRSC